MKILFVRHGESVDDLTDQYGGWADFTLTPKGKTQAYETADKIAKLNVKFSKVLSSPLQRAIEFSRIIANKLSIPQSTYVYLKEKNGYGLLSGLNKTEAKAMYPELVKSLEDGYVFGAEPMDKFIGRVKATVANIQKMESVNIIAVTHGGFMNQLFDQVLKKKFKKAHDGGCVLLESSEDLKLKIIKTEGIDYE